MAIFEMYQPLADGRRRLISTFDAETETIHMVTNAQPARLVTAIAPKATPKPKPTPTPPPVAARAARPPVITTMREAKQAILAELGREVPAPPATLDQVVERQRQLGLR